MGREAVAMCRWQGKVAEVKALLESHEIILRGDIRAKISRATISAPKIDKDALVLRADGETLRLELGLKEAEKWLAALLKPLPSLAEKLGVSKSSKAFVIGKVDDAELKTALVGAATKAPKDAAVLIAMLRNEADLKAAIKAAGGAAHAPVWCVYGKGKFATLSDSAIRTTMRANGFVDNKTSGVSDQLTATRYRLKQERDGG